MKDLLIYPVRNFQWCYYTHRKGDNTDWRRQRKIHVYTKQLYMANSEKMVVKFITFTKIYTEQSTNFQVYRILQVMLM
jgi:glutathionyl-hydroquinone reductase